MIRNPSKSSHYLKIMVKLLRYLRESSIERGKMLGFSENNFSFFSIIPFLVLNPKFLKLLILSKYY